jgi:hypothetical protein
MGTNATANPSGDTASRREGTKCVSEVAPELRREIKLLLNTGVAPA